jgi:hypothetical protein
MKAGPSPVSSPELTALRERFLEPRPSAEDYWTSTRLLGDYDRTFAQRIGWKWDFVLRELGLLGWPPPAGSITDWGCGTGIAVRRCIHHWDRPASVRGRSVLLWDRSAMAARFAAAQLQLEFRNHAAQILPSDPFSPPAPDPAPDSTLLLSHVITELDDATLERVVRTLPRFIAVLWVEPGTHTASRKLISVREQVRGTWRVVAPCTHNAPCGLLAPGCGAHWCHHHATPPGHIFHAGFWSRFARANGIDLRSLPLSYLVLDQRRVPALPHGTTRVLGRPVVHKAEALLLGCDANGVHTRRLTRRRLPAAFRQLKKQPEAPLQIWHCAGDEILTQLPLADDPEDKAVSRRKV